MHVGGPFVGHHLDAGAGKFDVVVVEARLKPRPARVCVAGPGRLLGERNPRARAVAVLGDVVEELPGVK